MRGLDFNNNWKFKLEEQLDTKNVKWGGWNPWMEGSAAYYDSISHAEDDNSWREVRLPHDWSVEFDFDLEKGEGCTGYLLGGKGVYRKHFATEESFISKKVIVNFDGIYNRATIYCNKKKIKFHPYGYSPCLVDITNYLKPLGEDNVLTVHVDHSRYADSRWYTGSGIYRKVSLHVLNQVNIPVWGTFFKSTQITDDYADVEGVVEVENNLAVDGKRVFLDITVKDPKGDVVLTKYCADIMYKNSITKVPVNFRIDKPMLWDLEETNMYTVSIDLSLEDKVVLQTEETKIGIRTSYFDANKGYILNGKAVKLKGVCIHHDAGLVGAAVPDDVWRRRFEILKDMGCNSIRTSHNPFSEDFFNLCDEMGFIVEEEIFDEWDYAKDKRRNCFNRTYDYISQGHDQFFREYAKSDMINVMKRDRNHPCIVQWSLGNEIEWTYPRYEKMSGYFAKNTPAAWGFDMQPYSKENILDLIENTPCDAFEMADTCKMLADWARELDTTRPLSVNFSDPCVSHESGATDPVDIVGYSHRHMFYEYGHENYPDKNIFGGETGKDFYDWQDVVDKDYVSGIYIWTGFDYMGESHSADGINHARSGHFGVLDFAGFYKPDGYMFKAYWQEKPFAYINTAPQDVCDYMLVDGVVALKNPMSYRNKRDVKTYISEHWNYQTGEEVLVTCYTNCDSATLYVNGKAVSTQKAESHPDRLIRWIVPFEAGEIKVVAENGEEYSIKTSGKATQIELSVDKKVIGTSFDEVCHIIATLKDEDGNVVSTDDKKITFNLSGAYINLGVDNGNRFNFESYQTNTVTTNRGRALMILQGKEKGEIGVNVSADGITSNTEVITVC